MKHLWTKAGTKVSAKGRRIEYRCKDFPGVSVYSAVELTPHANDSGEWLYHSYSVETSDGFKKEFRTLRKAKSFVENGGLEHESRS